MSVDKVHTAFSNLDLHFLHSPITRRQILDSSKLKEFADDNFKFHENDKVIQMGRKDCG